MTQLLQRSTTAHSGARRRSYAVVLELDDVSDSRVRDLWRLLDGAGIPSAAQGPGGCSAPHVTLAIADTDEPRRLHEVLATPLTSAERVRLPMTALGFFLTPRAPAYLAVAPTPALLELHRAVHDLLPASDSWSYYRPGCWTPHCTLAMEVTSPTLVAEAIGLDALPIDAVARRARVIPLPATSRARRGRGTAATSAGLSL